MNKMIVISDEALLDLYDCVYALMYPKYNNRPNLTEEDALAYRDDIINFIYSLADKTTHSDATFTDHKQQGKKVARYDRNNNTQYYIVYDLDTFHTIYVNRILTNHITKR